jgi:hypothetical protein
LLLLVVEEAAVLLISFQEVVQRLAQLMEILEKVSQQMWLAALQLVEAVAALQ